MSFKKIRELPGVLKDTESKAIINVDSQGLIAYKKKKQSIQEQKEFGQRLTKLEDGLSEIKELLIKALEK